MLTGSYKNKFGMLKFARIVFSLGAIVLAGCSSQEVYVYEKLPEASECRRYTDYWTVSACNRKHQIKMNEKLDSVIRTTNYRLSRKYNRRDKCKERKYRSAPQGCYITQKVQEVVWYVSGDYLERVWAIDPLIQSFGDRFLAM